MQALTVTTLSYVVKKRLDLLYHYWGPCWCSAHERAPPAELPAQCGWPAVQPAAGPSETGFSPSLSSNWTVALHTKNHKQGCLKSTLGDQSLHHQQKKAVIIKGKLQWLLLLLLLYSPEGIQRLKVKLITRHTNCIGLTIKHELFTHLLKPLMTVVAGGSRHEDRKRE